MNEHSPIPSALPRERSLSATGALVIMLALAAGLALLVLGAVYWLSGSSGRLTGSLSVRTSGQAINEGRDMMRANDYEGAQAAYARAFTQSAHRTAQLHFEYGLAADRAHNLPLAAEQYQAATVLAARDYRADPQTPLFADPFVGLAQVHRRMARQDKEFEVWTQLLALDEGQFVAHYNLGLIAHATRRPDVAVDHLRQCIDLLPQEHRGGVIEAKCVNLLGDLLHQAGQDEQALRHYQRALAIQPNNETLRHKMRLCRERIAAGEQKP